MKTRATLHNAAIGNAKVGLSEAMRVTAEAITQCKFEATDPSADEVVLYNILQVRGTLLLVTCAGNGLALCSQLYCLTLHVALTLARDL